MVLPVIDLTVGDNHIHISEQAVLIPVVSILESLLDLLNTHTHLHELIVVSIGLRVDVVVEVLEQVGFGVPQLLDVGQDLLGNGLWD